MPKQNHLNKYKFISILFISVFFISLGVAKAEWIQTSGPGGGSCLGLGAVGDTLYAGNYTYVVSGSYPTVGTLFMSTDHGQTWVADTIGFSGTLSSVCAIGDTVFASTYQNGLFRKVGSVWTRIAYGMSGAILFSHNGILYSGYEGTIDKSTDRGNTFTSGGFGLGPYTWFFKFYTIGDTLFAAANDGVYKFQYNSVWVNKFSRDVFGFYVRGNELFATTYDKKLFKSIDNAETWDSIGTGFNLIPFNIIGLGDTLIAIVRDTANGTLRNYLVRSFDNGLNWSPCANEIPTVGYILDLITMGNEIYASISNFGASVFRSTDFGDTWQEVNNGLANVRTNCFLNYNNSIYCGTLGPNGIHKSIDNGETWQPSGNGINIPAYYSVLNVTSIVANNNFMYAGTNTDRGLFQSNDNGTTWSVLNSVFDSTYITDVYADDSILIVSNNYLGTYRSTDNGMNWSNQPVLNYDLKAIVFFAGNYFAGTYGRGIWKSSDFGLTWSLSDTGLAPFIDISKLIVRGSDLIASTENGIYISSDTGATWTTLNNGLPSNRYASTIAAKSDTLIIGMRIPVNYSGDIFISYNNGVNWTNYNRAGYPYLVNDLMIIGDTIFAATETHSVWKRSLNDLITSTEHINIKSEDQFVIFPNPASNSVNIKLNEVSESNVGLKLYDASGRILMNEKKISSEYNFSICDFRNGLYFIQIITDKGITTKPLIIGK